MLRKTYHLQKLFCPHRNISKFTTLLTQQGCSLKQISFSYARWYSAQVQA